MIFIDILLLALGLVLLIKGADSFVDGASNIAKKLKIPSLIIGLTLVSIGTSAPELSISITSALKGMNDVSFGNVIGSNIFNTLVVIGASALISALSVSGSVKKFDIPILIGIYVLLTVFVFISSPLVFSRVESAFFLVLFVVYIVFLILRSRSEKSEEEGSETKKWYVSLILLFVGIAAIIYGGDLTVESAKKIALTFGMSDMLIGLTIVAIGTSLPELVTSIVAARKGELDIAVGNAVGSSIMNILLILGVSSVIRPISLTYSSSLDLAVMALSALIIFFASLKKDKISKPIGILMLIIYAAYIAYTVVSSLI